MKRHRLETFTKGWFVGDFEPTLHQTSAFEVAVKRYSSGEAESRHLHKVATEYTLVISGHIRMNGQEFGPNDIVEIPPGESTDFLALEEVVSVVVKVPSVKGDKYVVHEDKDA